METIKLINSCVPLNNFFIFTIAIPFALLMRFIIILIFETAMMSQLWMLGTFYQCNYETPRILKAIILGLCMVPSYIFVEKAVNWCHINLAFLD